MATAPWHGFLKKRAVGRCRSVMRELPVLRHLSRKQSFNKGQICRHLGVRPISLWDSEYGCATFVNQTADLEADKLMRLRPNRWKVGSATAL